MLQQQRHVTLILLPVSFSVDPSVGSDGSPKDNPTRGPSFPKHPDDKDIYNPNDVLVKPGENLGSDSSGGGVGVGVCS